jgi:hypothetical protein
MKEIKTIINPSLYKFVADIEESVKEGWDVDFENAPPIMWGLVYEVGMIREAEEKPKMSRAESLAVARAAKAEKRSQV